jgi:hypothetical protein
MPVQRDDLPADEILVAAIDLRHDLHARLIEHME